MAETEMTRRERWHLMLAGGAIAGAIGGLVIALLALAVHVFRAEDPWVGLKVAAYPFLGDRVLAPGFEAGVVVLGVIDHLVVAAIWGVLFALLAFGLSRWATVLFGAAWGLLALFGMTYVVLPLAGCMRVEYGMAPGPAVLTHVTFGVAMALAFLPFQRHEPRHADGWMPRTV